MVDSAYWCVPQGNISVLRRWVKIAAGNGTFFERALEAERILFDLMAMHATEARSPPSSGKYPNPFIPYK